MKPSVVIVLLLALATTGCAASAGHPTPASHPGAEPNVPPIASLLGDRERLGLTHAQVHDLETIAREWATADFRLHRDADRARALPFSALAVPLRASVGASRAEVEENNRRAVDAVERLLSPEQRQRDCEPRRAVSEPRVAPRGAFAPITEPAAWPWCGSGVAT